MISPLVRNLILGDGNDAIIDVGVDGCRMHVVLGESQGDVDW
jgi:hypothetical protein